MMDKTTIDTFSERIRGQLIQPEDPAYDQARTLYNAMIDKHPRLIVRCADVADVMAAIAFGRNQGLEIAIRSGGHNGPGLASVDDGLVIDLSGMKGIRVDPDNLTVRVEPGCTWKDVDHAAHAFGLATVNGIISTTGVSGLTLGGGHGYLSRKYGLTIDNLLAADVVLADGRLVHASESEHPDLFWALRGGGGNFGVVTSFLFRAHPLDTVYGGPIIWPVEQAGEIMRWYRDFIKEAPEDMSGWLGFHRVPTGSALPEELWGKHGIVFTGCYIGPPEKAEQLFNPIRKLAAPVLDMAGSMPFPELQSLFDEMYYPPGLQWYWKADFIKDISDEAIAIHQKHGSALPTERCTMHLYPINGAVHRVGRNDTAFSFRDVNWSQVIVGVDPDPANADRIKQWAKDYWNALHPHSAGGGYVNFMMEEGEDRIQATYRDNYAGLQKVKAAYDPENLFHVNQNIKPAAN
jgi:FAD/FMN-containing dehydrogenase